ncbi:OmpA/MotB domain protein [Desulfarculus baarsii DSM 2075]|uniref:OmpA/MotB domain protein n=1 Tax=Desulfarculus baarsii (strain ATCC 33931 / DSM 2075 / LMG 7858 / VKM B-1802 / 2st14) TaxID=644282 RepID=E1QHE5_DESB2|nr:OmpA family protein [Desulfarculus baarsii]ADK84988.1 OmpA/MotB domain protein [Desulfarculus baarsii DSM 2075]
MPPEKKIKKGSPPWMATFADLSTLLLTFFVLLLSMANMDVQKFREMLGSVQAAFGVQYEVQGDFQPVAVPTAAPSAQNAAAPSRRISEARAAMESRQMSEQVQNFVNETGLGSEVNVNAGNKGVRLRVKGHLFFEPGGAEIRQEAKKLLEGIAKVTKKFDFYLTVEGHTDDQPISTPRFPSNWELSAARAAAVLRYLAGDGVPEKRMSAIGYASSFPIAANTSEAGRNKNRRVEFVFTKQPPRLGID